MGNLMQITVYTGAGRAEKPNSGWRDNLKNSSSRKTMLLLNWRGTERRCFLTRVEEGWRRREPHVGMWGR